MRVCTYNIHAGTDVNKNPSLPQIIASLRELNADVVLLQEVDHFLPRSRFTHQARRVARVLGMQYAFYGRFGFGPFRFGNAVLFKKQPNRGAFKTRLPATGGEPRCAVGIWLPEPGIQWSPGWAFWKWGRNHTPGMIFYSVHLGLRNEWRMTQLAELADWKNSGFPILVGGDFNAEIDAPEIRKYLEDTDFSVYSGEQLTFPVPHPTHRIDFLFGSGFHKTGGGCIIAPGSDHCLVWADLEISDKHQRSTVKR